MGVFDDCMTEQEVHDKLNSLKRTGEVSLDVEWEAQFRILEINSAPENTPRLPPNTPSTSTAEVCVI